MKHTWSMPWLYSPLKDSLSGDAIILILTDAHIRPILERLIAEGFNDQTLITSGQIIYINAERLLASLMVDGIFNHTRCEAIAHEMLTQTRTAVGAGCRIRVFGEMVDLIWRSQLRVTERIEQLWDELARKHSLVVFCAYAVSGNEREALPPGLLACHYTYSRKHSSDGLLLSANYR